MQFLLQHVERSLFPLLLHSNRLDRLWQRPLIHLLILIQRNGLNLHGGSRDHIGWLLVEDEVVQRLDIYLLVADNICRNKLTAAASFLIEGLNRSIFYARELTDHGFHFLQLDTETANLHLSVATTYKSDITIRQITYDVTTLIDPVVFAIIKERIVDKHLCRLFRTVQITTNNLRRGDPKFTTGTYRQTMPAAIHYIQFAVRHRYTDRNILPLLLQIIGSHIADGFRRTIAVGHDIA